LNAPTLCALCGATAANRLPAAGYEIQSPLARGLPFVPAFGIQRHKCFKERRRIMKRFILAAVIGLASVGGMAAMPSAARAYDDDGWYGFGGPGFGRGFGGFGGAWGGYYGNGGHDSVPHWHQTTTPFGSYNWFGLGTHDFQPHVHTYSPYSYEGSSVSPFGYTRSFYSPSPNYYYAPW
jgi:hypothetical protein